MGRRQILLLTKHLIATNLVISSKIRGIWSRIKHTTITSSVALWKKKNKIKRKKERKKKKDNHKNIEVYLLSYKYYYLGFFSLLSIA